MKLRIDEPISRFKACIICHKAIPKSSQSEYCPSCYAENRYREIKEYILANDVTELEVADHFDISVAQVKQWINEGRIEYKK